MNSTDDNRLDALLGDLFDQVLMPMAQRMREAGQEAFPRYPDVSWLSYYVRRKRSVMLPADFSGIACADGTEFAANLAQHWNALGRHELALLAPAFGQAADAARDLQRARQPERELSPYVYAMF